MKVPLLDLKCQYAAIREHVEAAIADVMDSQHFILGPKVERCEQEIATYCGCSYGIGVSSGTDALLACMMAENIGRGDEVITTAYTFFATAGSIARLGATPVFVDINPTTFNLDTTQLEAKVTRNTRAIIPVHLYGQMADMDAVMRVAHRHNLTVIEDAAQAIGAEDQGARAGSVGHYGCLSFFPSKNLGAAGDGGLVVTQDAQRADTLRILRTHGSKPKYYNKLLGGNFRLDAIQAAIVSAKLPYLDAWTAIRQRNARQYDEMFTAAGLAGPAVSSSHVVLPTVNTTRHVYNQYVIRAQRRDELQEDLRRRGIATEVYYPVPMHLQECFAYLGYGPGSYPESEEAAATTLALPVHPGLTAAQQRYVVECVGEFVRSGERSKVAVATARTDRQVLTD